MSNLNKIVDMKFVEKGWGWERWIVNKEEYCGKLLYFNKWWPSKIQSCLNFQRNTLIQTAIE